jgi:hypothetical protein
MGHSGSCADTHTNAQTNKSMETSLTEDRFQVVKPTGKDTVIICEGEDKTPRVLAFIGQKAPTRGKIELFQDETSCNIVAQCCATNMMEGRIEVAAIMDLGEKLAFRAHSDHYKVDEIFIYQWDGEDIHCVERISWDRWKKIRDMNGLLAGGKQVL